MARGISSEVLVRVLILGFRENHMMVVSFFEQNYWLEKLANMPVQLNIEYKNTLVFFIYSVGQAVDS
jgi:hypothetical protein